MNFILFVLFGLFSFNSVAEIKPKTSGYDSRVLEVRYNPKNVVRIDAAVGFGSLIQLEEGESVLSKKFSGVGIGDQSSWAVSFRENNIFIKPVVLNGPKTNLLVVSDKNRTYSFDLSVTKNVRSSSYVVKFLYPQKKEPKKKIPCSDGRRNFQYVKWGDDYLSPKFVWDDGRFTCFKFVDNVELPVIYTVDQDGRESLINSHLEKDVLVVHFVSKEFRLRLGEMVLGVETLNLKKQGFNHKGTTQENLDREIIKNG